MPAEIGEPLPLSIEPGAHADTQRYWRRRILWAATVTHAIYYYCCVNISLAILFLQPLLGYSKTELGVVGSGLQVLYGLGKFLNGLIADRTHPRYFMAAGLLLSGVALIMAALALPEMSLRLAPPGNARLIALGMAACGFCVYGPSMLAVQSPRRVDRDA